MSEWAIVAIILIITTYKTITYWIDSQEDSHRETDMYSTTETMPHDTRDDSERRIPDVKLGFQQETP